ncbi:MAG: flavodoxin family protein [Deferrisomatales bacterium]
MILAICGSGRTGGNGARLLAAAAEGACGEAGQDAAFRNLASLEFRGCTGCGACRREASACVLADELTPVLHATASAPALFLATPIYYGYASGLFKSYLDRWYAFRDGNRTLRLPAGRPAVLVVTQGHPDPEAYRWTLDSLERVLSSYGFRVSRLVAAGLEGPGEAARRPDLLDRARQLGAAAARETRAD